MADTIVRAQKNSNKKPPPDHNHQPLRDLEKMNIVLFQFDLVADHYKLVLEDHRCAAPRIRAIAPAAH